MTDDKDTTTPDNAIKPRTLTLGEAVGRIRIDLQVGQELSELGERIKRMSPEDRDALEKQIRQIGENLLTASTGFSAAGYPFIRIAAQEHQRRLIEEALLKAERQDDAPPG
ncbi:MAG: hypothetical protein JNJ61_10715 [Anaerolineae bacterium]|nr:hypothetical protein [Anaerolineae bacterium]